MRMATGAEGIQRTTTIQITSSRRMLGRRALQETEGEAGNHMHIGNLPYSRKSAEKLMMQEILRWLASF